MRMIIVEKCNKDCPYQKLRNKIFGVEPISCPLKGKSCVPMVSKVKVPKITVYVKKGYAYVNPEYEKYVIIIDEDKNE